MADDTKTIKASCLCGAAKHEINISSSHLPLEVHLCHCNSCRHVTGTLALTAISMPAVYQPQPHILEKCTSYQFSENVTTYSCETCGSMLLHHFWLDYQDHSKGYQWSVMSGSLEKFDGNVEVDSHIFIGDTLDGGLAEWLPSANGKEIPRFARSDGDEEQLPVAWRSKDRPQIQPSAEDRLHGHCKCGGVNFWVARPSERSKEASSPWPDVLIPYHLTEKHPDPAPWWLVDNGKKFLGGVCACNSCRLDTGMEWVQWAFVPTIDVSLDAEGKQKYEVPFGTLKAYNSSKAANGSRGVTRYHCGVCGASVFFTTEERPTLIDIAVGLLDAPEGARAESWLEFQTDRLSFREDAAPRAESITAAIEEGLKSFGARQKA